MKKKKSNLFPRKHAFKGRKQCEYDTGFAGECGCKKENEIHL